MRAHGDRSGATDQRVNDRVNRARCIVVVEVKRNGGRLQATDALAPACTRGGERRGLNLVSFNRNAPWIT